MNKLIFLFTLTLISFFFSFAHKTNCDQIPTKFTSYKEASIKIKKSKFKVTDNVNTSNSSWISKASYYSCNGNTGFFIIIANGKEYIHKDVPFGVWKQFKTASSFGSFYNKSIKNKYTLRLN